MTRQGALMAVVGLLFPAILAADYPVSTESMNLTFSEFGDLLTAELCFPSCDQEGARRMQIGSDITPAVATSLNPGEWVLTPGFNSGSRIMSFSHVEGAEITWRIPENGYRLELEVDNTHSAVEWLKTQSGRPFSQRSSPGFGRWLEAVRYVSIASVTSNFEGRQTSLDEQLESPWQSDGWVGFKNRYWALMLRSNKSQAYKLSTGPAVQDAEITALLEAGVHRFTLYLGPLEPDVLASADADLGALLYGGLWFWLRWICIALFWLLAGIHGLFSEFLPPQLAWGLSIMALSLLVHVLMRPLSYFADRLQDSVHETESRLAPELSRIRREHRGEAQAEKILALYKREGVHPLYSLKSLLGVAIVIPVFIGAFDMLAENIHLAGTSFLWIDDLSRPDAIAALPFDLPFFGAQLNLLPFLMTGLSVLASWLHRPPSLDPSLRHKQWRNMLLLALAFFVLFYTFPAGMVLYWTTNNLISATKGWWRHRRDEESAQEVEK